MSLPPGTEILASEFVSRTMLYFLYPWALISLLSMVAIVFLYFYVFRGKRIEVSSLHLWQMARSLRLEGQHKHKPPITLPFLLEVLTALILSLLVAGAAMREQSEFPHLAVILDSSASMNAHDKERSFLEGVEREVEELFRSLGSGGRVTLIQSGFEPMLIGREAMEEEEAMEVLAQWRPSGPSHAFQPAVELARALTGEKSVPVLFTDHQLEVPGVDVIAVGFPVENTGWISYRWLDSSHLFVLAHHFGEGGGRKTMSIIGNGQPMGERDIDFSEKESLPLRIEIHDEVSFLQLELPPDGLENDNILRVSRPMKFPLDVQIDLDEEGLVRQIEQAVEATGRGRVSAQGNEAIRFCREGREEKDNTFLVRIHNPGSGGQTCIGPFVVNAAHPLTQGVDLQGVIWRADPGFEAGNATVLLSSAHIPLAVLDGKTIILNMDAKGTTVFTLPAWPVLIANLLEYVYEISPGLKRSVFRLGESLSFVRPSAWEGEVKIHEPKGKEVAFQGKHIYYGRLESEGIYRISCAGEDVASIDVNLLSQGESDLRKAKSTVAGGRLRPSRTERRRGRTYYQEGVLLALIMLLLCWFLLERRAA